MGPETMHEALVDALVSECFDALPSAPSDDRDALLSLLAIHDLWTQPYDAIEGVHLQNHPAVASLKWSLEKRLIAGLDASTPRLRSLSGDAVVAMRRIANGPGGEIYTWIADRANWHQVVKFLAIEGGPDGGFDDLVATCQIGLRGMPKLVLAANYWDEMGRGEIDDVHTVLHDRLVQAVDLPRIERSALPTTGLRRAALNGVLATNRYLQPEMLGALGLLELQAGPRCRSVLRAFERLHAPADAFPFYQEHATADPRHGKEWLDGVIAPLAAESSTVAARMVRGAQWRADVNRQLFDELFATLDVARAHSA